MATAADLEATEELRKTKARTMVASRKLIREHRLPMKVLAVDPQPGAGKIVIYYSSPETVDFRSLLRDLSATLGSRIELRQLAARDAVRVTGAIGSCGRDTCCSTFLKDYEPITLAMARDQDLPANPMRISGACGRLMCCLKYEHPLYQDFKATAPAIGEEVDSPAGPGRVVGHSVPGRLRRHQARRRRIPAGLPEGVGVRVAQGLRGAPPAAGLTRRSRASEQRCEHRAHDERRRGYPDPRWQAPHRSSLYGLIAGITPPFSMRTWMAASGACAGPASGAPVVMSKELPWQGQLIRPLPTVLTRQA